MSNGRGNSPFPSQAAAASPSMQLALFISTLCSVQANPGPLRQVYRAAATGEPSRCVPCVHRTGRIFCVRSGLARLHFPSPAVWLPRRGHEWARGRRKLFRTREGGEAAFSPPHGASARRVKSSNDARLKQRTDIPPPPPHKRTSRSHCDPRGKAARPNVPISSLGQ